MCAQNVTAKRKQKRSRQSQQKLKRPLEFSKKLTIIDVVTWVFLALILLIILVLRPELGAYAQTIFAYLTTAYVSLRLGYTAKAGVENYKKIAENYKAIAELAPDTPSDNSESSDEDEELG